jgi:aspartate 1-decarboxylase
MDYSKIMQIKLFKSKIHRATITQADLHYEGSLTIDEELMKAAKIYCYEAVYVWNVNNGQRLMTYALPGIKDSGIIQLNGSAARMGHVGDLIIITTFADMTEKEALQFKPTVVLVDSKNKIKEVKNDSGAEYEELG